MKLICTYKSRGTSYSAESLPELRAFGFWQGLGFGHVLSAKAREVFVSRPMPDPMALGLATSAAESAITFQFGVFMY